MAHGWTLTLERESECEFDLNKNSQQTHILSQPALAFRFISRIVSMQVSIFGSTGALGRELLVQALEAGHKVTVLVRTPAKIPEAIRSQIEVVQGDALDSNAVAKAIPEGTEVVLFAIGVVKKSPANLCHDVTNLILDRMKQVQTRRLVWCGGGSNRVEQDVVTFGAKFVGWYAKTFMKKKHMDKQLQLASLMQRRGDAEWVGVRPLQVFTLSIRTSDLI